MTRKFHIAIPESTRWTVRPVRGDRSNREATVMEARTEISGSQ